MKHNEIVFTLNEEDKWIPNRYYPTPAAKLIPEWYKKIESYSVPPTNGAERRAFPTIKRCMPVFDSISSGYLILTHTDIEIFEDGTFGWANDLMESVSKHAKEQVYNYKDKDVPVDMPKFRNPWNIKTAKGYSCLFISPMHRPTTGLKILEGIVDTDNYFNAVQLPMQIVDNFVGTIPAGTPIAQVIPIKRDSWKMRIGDDKDRKESKDVWMSILASWSNGYRRLFRENKEYL
jgi:hypothetical protein